MIKSVVKTQYCLDVVDAKLKVGTPLQIWTCKKSKKGNQMFEIKDNQIRLVKDPNLCVADSKHAYENEAALTLISCLSLIQRNPIPSFTIAQYDPASNMGLTWAKPSGCKPQCANGEKTFSCNHKEYGRRISCPESFPIMCHDPEQCSGNTADFKKDRCCAFHLSKCNGGRARAGGWKKEGSNKLIAKCNDEENKLGKKR